MSYSSSTDSLGSYGRRSYRSGRSRHSHHGHHTLFAGSTPYTQTIVPLDSHSSYGYPVAAPSVYTAPHYSTTSLPYYPYASSSYRDYRDPYMHSTSGYYPGTYVSSGRHHRRHSYYGHHGSSYRRYRDYMPISHRILRFFGLHHLIQPNAVFIDPLTGYDVDRWGRPVYRV